jgi:thiamine kinase-like enzyme
MKIVTIDVNFFDLFVPNTLPLNSDFIFFKLLQAMAHVPQVAISLSTEEIGSLGTIASFEERSEVIEKLEYSLKELSLVPSSSENIPNFQIQRISGGLTNALYLIRSTAFSFIIRIFGNGTELYIDRSVENLVFATFSEAKFGPKLYGLLSNGRLEEYFEGMRPLEPSEMSLPEIYPFVASTVYQLHQFTIETLRLSDSEWLWSKINSLLEIAISSASSINLQSRFEFYQLLNLSQIQLDLQWLYSKIIKLKEQSWIEITVDNNDELVYYSKGHIFGQRLALQIVLCHNDLLSGNILRTTTATTTGIADHNNNDNNNNDNNNNHEEDYSLGIKLIDYEYAAYNYRAYDFANHFCGKKYILLLLLLFDLLIFSFNNNCL